MSLPNIMANHLIVVQLKIKNDIYLVLLQNTVVSKIIRIHYLGTIL